MGGTEASGDMSHVDTGRTHWPRDSHTQDSKGRLQDHGEGFYGSIEEASASPGFSGFLQREIGFLIQCMTLEGMI